MATVVGSSLTATFPVSVSSTAQGGGGATLTIIAGQGQLMSAEHQHRARSSLRISAQGFGDRRQRKPNRRPPCHILGAFRRRHASGDWQHGADSQVVNTNAAGVASVDFLTTQFQRTISPGYLQSLVTATAANTNAVTFYITTVHCPLPLLPGAGARLYANRSPREALYRARCRHGWFLRFGFGIPNVSLSLDSGATNPNFFPTVACNAPGGVVLTSSPGIASCDVDVRPPPRIGDFRRT